MKALIVLGTRPEAIKLAPVYQVLQESPRHEVRVCVTGQHREMVDPVLALFRIFVDHDLDLMRPDQTPTEFVSRSLTSLGSIMERDRPDVVIVQGDTSTALAAALAAFYLRIPVAHVEAGLRTGDRRIPFPEETHRLLTDAISDFLFAPTEEGRSHLLRENYSPDRIFVTGNTVVDALNLVVAHTRANRGSPERDDSESQSLYRRVADAGRVVLVTYHRRESFGEGIRQISFALRDLSSQNPDVMFVCPVHMNPNVRAPVEGILSSVPGVHLVPPVPYDTFVWLMNASYFIMTDSGGIQEEAPSLGKPVLIMREKTERREAELAGVARLVGTRQSDIVTAAQTLLDDPKAYRQMVPRANPFGDGHAAERIVETLERELRM